MCNMVFWVFFFFYVGDSLHLCLFFIVLVRAPSTGCPLLLSFAGGWEPLLQPCRVCRGTVTTGWSHPDWCWVCMAWERGVDALSICWSPVGTHIPALGVMLWSPAGAHIPAHIPAFAWWSNQPSFEGLEPPESQGLAFISAVGTEH